MPSSLRLVAALVALGGCQADRVNLGTADSSRRAEPASASRDAVKVERHVYPAPKRLVAFGDVHGDLAAAQRALRLAGATDASGAWIGGDLFVVQVGDQLDRGDDDRAILDYFEKLRKEAQAAGGTFLALNGNHELMNAAFDFRYATEGADRAFDDVDVPSELTGFDPPSRRGRAAAFRPGGPYAKKLAEQPLYAIVGGSVFAHGGILKKHLDYGLEKMDDEVKEWLLGSRKSPPKVVMSEDGPVWTRAFSAQTGPDDCANLAGVLDALGRRRMVMGHTPQRAGVSFACDDKAVRIDVGLARYYQGPMEVLEVVDETTKVLRE